MVRPTLSLPDLLDVPEVEAKILTQLTRHCAADAEALAEAIGGDVAEVREALATLVQTGRIRLSADGRAHVTFGWSRRRTLPADLWRALSPADRPYSEQEIVTLRAVIPMLQFARAKLGEFADHGPAHALRVKSFATQLAYVLGLTKTEQYLLRAAALFHDVGNVVDRHRHHIISQETVERLAAVGELPFSSEEAAVIGLCIVTRVDPSASWSATCCTDCSTVMSGRRCRKLIRPAPSTAYAGRAARSDPSRRRGSRVSMSSAKAVAR